MLIVAFWPICADVFAVTTSTAPPIATLPPPLIAMLIPTVAMSSLFVAVTATPRKPVVTSAETVRGPVAEPSEEGTSPCLTMLWDLPVPVPDSGTIVPPSVEALLRSCSVVVVDVVETPLAKYVPQPDEDALVDMLTDANGSYGLPPDRVADSVMIGKPTQVAERLERYAEYGADRIITTIPAGDWRRQAELFAEARRLAGQ